MRQAFLRWFKWVALASLLFMGLLVCIPVGIGAMQPREHIGAGEALVAAPPIEVWETIVDYEAMATWSPGIGQMERLADIDGLPAFRETRDEMVLEFTFKAVDAPNHLVVDLVDGSGVFGGTWTFELSPEGQGTRLKITEEGWIDNALFRFVTLLVGADATVDQYLAAMVDKFD